jgi:hypothetical protein
VIAIVLWARPSDRRWVCVLYVLARVASLRRSPLYSLLASPPALPYTAHPLPLRSPSPVRRLRSSVDLLAPLPYIFPTQRTRRSARSIRSLPPLLSVPLPFRSLLLPPSPIPLSSSPLPPAPSSATAHLLSCLPLPHLLTSFRSLNPPSPRTPRQRGRGRSRARDTPALDRAHDLADARYLELI